MVAERFEENKKLLLGNNNNVQKW